MGSNLTPGQFLKMVRLKNGKTQKEIAKFLKTNTSSVSMVENDKKGIAKELLSRWIEVYGCTEAEQETFKRLLELKTMAHFSALVDCQKGEEYEVFYRLINLPKETRERITSAVIAYDSVK